MTVQLFPAGRCCDESGFVYPSVYSEYSEAGDSLRVSHNFQLQYLNQRNNEATRLIRD